MKARILVERTLYAALFVALACSVVLFIGHDRWPAVWEIYNRAYFFMLLLYTWFIFILLAIGRRGNAQSVTHSSYRVPERAPRIAVLVPCYNEAPELLYKSIRSVILAEGKKDVYIVDDGSANAQTKLLIRRFAEKYQVQVHFFDSNKGKRHAIHYAVTEMVGDADFVVTIDSDTILDKLALQRILEPFDDPRVGATSGDVRLLNEKQNILTRMIGAYYWIGLHIYKQAQSNVGMVVCCSGCLSAYRAPLLRSVIDDFVNQTFFGEQCTHSEDRHLTNLILKSRHLVKFVPEAVSYTETPATIRGFLKQQQRWKRGYIRESIYTLTYAWKTRPLLFIEVAFWELSIPFLSFGLMIAMVISVASNPLFFVTNILPAWLTFMVVRYMPIFFYGLKKVPGLLVYMLFYDIFLYWQSIYALFTVRNKSWITR